MISFNTVIGVFIFPEVFQVYAIIKTGGKQYKVSEGSEIIIEKLDAEANSTVTFDEVLGIFDGDTVKIGTPQVEGGKVKALRLKKEPKRLKTLESATIRALERGSRAWTSAILTKVNIERPPKKNGVRIILKLYAKTKEKASPLNVDLVAETPSKQLLSQGSGGLKRGSLTPNNLSTEVL